MSDGRSVVRRGVAAAAALLLLTGCGATAVPVDAPRMPADARQGDAGDREAGAPGDVCRSVLRDVPTWLGDSARRDVRPDTDGDREGGTAAGPELEDVAAAWGDPAAILRCGVPRPDAFRPNSACIRVEGVDWFAEEAERGYVFTTVGREVNVEVSVPDEHHPESELLVDLAPAIEENNPVREPCV